MHTGRVRRSVLVAVLTAFLVVGCSPRAGTDAEPVDPQPTPVDPITLDDLGLDDWPSVDEPRIPEAPARPRGVSAREYDRMIDAVRTWALEAVEGPDAVGRQLSEALTGAIDRAAEAQTASELARGTVLDPALEVRDVRMTAAWRAAREDGAVNLSLQTRTAYEVRADGGPVRVIGVLRTQGVVALPDAPEWGTIMGWQEFGAADCAIVLDGHLTPGGDADDQLADLTEFVRIGESDEAITPALPEDERVDEDFAAECRRGRA